MSKFSDSVSLSQPGAYVTHDFQLNVGGLVPLSFGATTTPDAKFDLAFSESDLFAGPESDDSTDLALDQADGALRAAANPLQSYTMPMKKLRGAFRYFTVVSRSTSATIEITKVELNYTAMPHWDDLRAYKGYFYSNDDLLNRIWYACAYTVYNNFTR
jgi:hypothetical protein